jgi:hypothetical protein
MREESATGVFDRAVFCGGVGRAATFTRYRRTSGVGTQTIGFGARRLVQLLLRQVTSLSRHPPQLTRS